MAVLNLVHFPLCCGVTKGKNENLKVRNMTLECQSIFSKGRQKYEQIRGLLNRKDRRCILYVITSSTGKEILGGNQFLLPKETTRTLASRKDTAGVTRANFILSVVLYAGNTVK